MRLRQWAEIVAAAVEGLKLLELSVGVWLGVAWAQMLEQSLATRPAVGLAQVHSLTGGGQEARGASRPRVVLSAK